MDKWGGDQNYRPERKHADVKKADNKVGRRPADSSEDAASKAATIERDYRVGKTIAGATNNARRRNLEHIALRKKQQRRNAIIIILILGMAIFVGVLLSRHISERMEAVERQREEEAALLSPTEPTVTIVDENVGNNISARVKTFVARLEADAVEYNLKVDHVVLPFQKAREIWVYFMGRNEYYKMTTERGSTVQVEDAERMIRYLQQKELNPSYVDLRVEGKAYYK